MTEVAFENLDDGWWAIEFEYDREVVAVLKDVPKDHRTYIPRRKTWEVSPQRTAAVVLRLREIGCDIFGIRLVTPDELAQEQAQRESVVGGDQGTGAGEREWSWADGLFARVAFDRPDLIEPVFRALSKVFYGRPGESESLQAELNAARERFTSRNAS